ncbi:MAG: SDR family oxidoreductase [Actinomycetota bacterium]
MSETSSADRSATSPKRVLVTGASSGIGAAAVVALSGAGHVVHAVARRADRLQELAAATGCTTWALDVLEREAVESTIESIGAIDVLVNNAGLALGWGTLAEASYADIERTVSTNVTSALHVLQQVLPGMIERSEGHVVNLGSMAGLYPTGSALYGATKGAMHRLSTNLRLELQGTGVRVTEICPGRIDTEFYDVAVADVEERRRIVDTGAAGVTAAECADTILYAISVPRHVNINRIELQPVEQTYGGSQFVLEGQA